MLRGLISGVFGLIAGTPKVLPNAELLFVIPEELHMAVSYKKLWKLLIDKDIKKKDLSSMAGISPAT